MKNNKNNHIQQARTLTDDFLDRTGISNSSGNPRRRYLWTDAFAVQNCFALANILNSAGYRKKALRLIERVHVTLGQHRPDDSRAGWISGLPDNEGKIHPTAGGLRIGKDNPEQNNSSPYNRRQEWDRDGQYFHYLMRWFSALVQAQQETGERTYGIWASELLEAGRKFISHDDGMYTMHWKMNIDLSKPVVTSMGAHDPLEGLVGAAAAMDAMPESRPALEMFEEELKRICRGMDWFTTDALGIGALLFNTANGVLLKSHGKKLPACARPEYLFSEAIASLRSYTMHVYDSLQPAEMRLAFRECGLSLGIRVVNGLREGFINPGFDLRPIEEFLDLAGEIEDFWLRTDNQESPTWLDHLDINSITLAASLLAKEYPQAYCAVSKK